MAGGGGDRRGRRRSRDPLHPRRSPLEIDTKVDGMGAGTGLRITGGKPQSEPLYDQQRPPHPLRSPPETDLKVDGSAVGTGLCFPGRKTEGGPMPDQEGRRRAWWDRAGQRIVIQGVDFAPDSQDGGGDEFYHLPESGDEACGGGSIDPEGDEVVPETEAQDLQAMEDNGSGDGVNLLSGAAKRLRKISSEDGAGLVAVVTDLVQEKVTSAPSVTSDAETDDENADSWEDFKSNWARLFLPDYSQAFKRKRD